MTELLKPPSPLDQITARKRQQFFNVERVKQDVVDWLSQIRFPSYPHAQTWDDVVKVLAEDSPESLYSHKAFSLRLAVKFYTHGSQYLISVIECHEPDAVGVGILTVHVNWERDEKQIQEKLDEIYHDGFKDILRARHTLWAQTFRNGEIHQGLNSCALAILGHELLGHPSQRLPEELLRKHSQPFSIPEADTE